MTRVGIILGSTRPGRKADAVGQWVYKLASQRGSAEYEIVDLADYDLPLLNEPAPAAMGTNYVHESTKRWSEKIASFDGYVFVTPEYNRSTSGVLKNGIDYLYYEWRNKSAGFVGYGLLGATRAVEHLRLMMGELAVADVRDQVTLSLFTDFANDEIAPADHHHDILTRMLDQVESWGQALAPLRDA